MKYTLKDDKKTIIAESEDIDELKQMAYIEFPNGKYNGAKAIYNVIHYIINPQKNPYGITNAKNVSEEELSHITERFRDVQ